MLLSDARSVRASLMRAEAARSGIEEAEALSTKRIELQKLADRIATLVRLNALLREQSVLLTPIPGIDKAKQLISQISARFAESLRSDTLVDKQRWSKLVSMLTEFSATAETLQKQDWKDYFSRKLFGGVPPEQRKQTILQALPENRKASERYTYLYQRFSQYRNVVPSTAEVLREVHAFSNELASIQFVENDEVPIPVRAFFNAVSSGSGASLDFLTQEVIEWLRTNNMAANYVVRAR
ncbi:protein DpdI [Pseudomonas nitroreducens]|uniref:protein DpdI n=1 Tax=Pseudomonas nitroreducens TaxID=46680 RepID=UPI003D2CF6CC